MLGFIIVSHLLALISVWVSALNPLMQGSLSLALFCSGYYAVKRYYLLGSTESISAIYRFGNQWKLVFYGGRSVEVTLFNELYITSWFISVRFHEHKRRRNHAVALFYDSADQNELRKLRVWLTLSTS